MASGRIIAGVMLWLVVVIGGGALLARHDVGIRWVPALSFPGADALYVLRRIAGEAGVVLAVDELFPVSTLGDLEFRRIDTDLQPGPIAAVLDSLQSQLPGWSHRFEDGVLYVRSDMLEMSDTPYDTPLLPAATLEVDLPGLVEWIMSVKTSAFLTTTTVPGLPVHRRVKLDIPENSSVIDALLLYAKASGNGWRLRRAGQRQEASTGQRHETSVVGSELQIWRALDEPILAPPKRAKMSAIQAVAHVARRTETPVCVLDHTVWGINVGSLDYIMLRDPQQPADEALDSLGYGTPPRRQVFRWEWDGPVAKVETRFFLASVFATNLLRERLEGGRFQGRLGDLARWINSHRLEPSDRVLSAGEILPSHRVARLDIERGATVEEVLMAFARSSKSCWNYVVLDSSVKVEQRELPAFAWRGAYLSPVEAWADPPDGSYQ